MKFHYDVLPVGALSYTTMHPLIQLFTRGGCHTILFDLKAELLQQRARLLWLPMRQREVAFVAAWPGSEGRR